MLIETRKKQILSNYNFIRDRITRVCEKSGRDPSEVDILAVTKYAASEDIKNLLEITSIKFIGESRVQDAEKKWRDALKDLRGEISLHMIGHLQKNKAKKICELFDALDSLDDIKTAEILDGKLKKVGKKLPVLIQIKLTESPTQSGILPQNAAEFLKQMRRYSNLIPRGYMAIAPLTNDTDQIRRAFRKVKEIYKRDFPEQTNSEEPKNYLSLGMSLDFEIAVEEGSTLPRIGSLLFKGAEI